MKVYKILNPHQSWKAGSGRQILPKLAKDFDWGDISYSPNGKPLLEHGFCSVSHSGNLLVVVWDTQAIGLDIEQERSIHPDLIARLQMNPENPMRDWCIREAWIKLDDKPEYLTQPLDSSLILMEIPLQEGFMAMAVSHHPLQIDFIRELTLVET